MLVIRIEIWPDGNMSKARILGHGTISNISPDTLELGSYEASFDSMGPGGPIYREAVVERFKRQERDSWELLYLALKDIFGRKRRKKNA